MNEFELVSKYLRPLSLKNEGSLKLSDDVYYNSKKKIVISVDTYVEGRHFINSSEPKKFLIKILRASLSDLYCKGVKPQSYFLSFALNKSIVSASWLKKIKDILRKEQKRFKISLAGGDTTMSSKLVISIIVLGYATKKPVFRHTCSFNDDIYVTGNIGDSFLGLNVLNKKVNYGKYNKFFVERFYKPELPVKVSSYLNEIASSSIDISDGLAQDLHHICKNSQCGAFIDLNCLPLSINIKKLVKKKRVNLLKIFSRGDDYQVLFTSKRKFRSKIISLSKKLNTKITKIGFIKKDKNIVFKYNMNKFKLNSKKMGYIHNF